MRRNVLLLLIAIAVFVAAYTARHLLLPGVVPVAVESDQTPWQLQAAFLLRALENVGAFGAVVIVVAAIAQRYARRKDRDPDDRNT
jgi:hypothetical protein